MEFDSVTDATEAIANGKFVIIVDDPLRENEGDVVIAAEKITEEAVAFMASFCRGLICVPMMGDRLDHLELPLMSPNTTALHSTAFTISVDTRKASTGISAKDRAMTIRALVDPQTSPSDLSRPGHVFPLRYSVDGVLTRQGQTEASIDLLRLTDLYPAAVICEIVNEDGTMARGEELTRFRRMHDLKMISVAQVAEFIYGVVPH